MSDLFEKSMRTLELPAVLEMLAQRAVSDEAKERCRRLRPSTEYPWCSSYTEKSVG